MSYLRRFGRFWWEFLVGDNLLLALGAGAAVAVTALLVDEGVNAWWLLPVAIVALLSASVITAARTASRGGRDSRKQSDTSPMTHG
jgi:membrane protein implicated in regulation of membrane protease activity